MRIMIPVPASDFMRISMGLTDAARAIQNGERFSNEPEREAESLRYMSDDYVRQLTPIFEQDYHNRAFIGLSLSGCVRDILRNEVSIGRVLTIVAGTKIDSPEHAWDCYKDTYWSEFERDTVICVLRDLWDRIVQPRKFLNLVHGIPHGHWIMVGTSW